MNGQFSHPAYKVLDDFFKANIAGQPPPPQGGKADAVATVPTDPEQQAALEQQAAINEVGRDSAFVAMLLKAMGQGAPRAV